MPLAASGSGGTLSLLLIILIPVAMYFLMIRPQQRRMREAQAMQSALGPGDEVMTTSGMYGTVAELDDENSTVDLEISPGVTVTFARAAVARVITPAERDDDGPAAEVDHPTDAALSADQVIERKD